MISIPRRLPEQPADACCSRVVAVIVSATDESRAFWLKQGCHAPAFCAPAEKAALRSLKARGLLKCFSNSHLMARPCAEVGGRGEDEGTAEPGGSAPDEAELLHQAIDKLGQERTAGLTSRKAAAALGFVDAHASGNIWQRDGSHEPVAYEAHEALPVPAATRLGPTAVSRRAPAPPVPLSTAPSAPLSAQRVA